MLVTYITYVLRSKSWDLLFKWKKKMNLEYSLSIVAQTLSEENSIQRWKRQQYVFNQQKNFSLLIQIKS